jgi:hypothetical protein
MKIYVALNDENGKHYAFLDEDYANSYAEEWSCQAVITVESEALGWMKQAADAACRFIDDSNMGSLEIGTPRS